MGGLLSRPRALGGRGSDVELAGTYQRFDAPEADAAWVAGRREGCVDYTAALAPLMGENVANRSLMVRQGSSALADLQHALDLNHPRDAESSLVHQLARDGQNAGQFSLEERFALLRDAGVDLDLSSDGLTPLHAAVLAGNQLALDALLAAGANPNARDTEGRTPLDLALAAQARVAADPEQGGHTDADAMLTTLQAYAAFAGTPAAPRLDVDKWGRVAASVVQTSGLALSSVGLGVVVMGLATENRLRQGIDYLSQAQSQNAASIAALDQALVGSMSKLTAAQVGPVETLTAEAADAELRRCVARESIKDLLPLLPLRPVLPGRNPGLVIQPIGQPVMPMPRPTMFPRAADGAKFGTGLEGGDTGRAAQGAESPAPLPEGRFVGPVERPLPDPVPSKTTAGAIDATKVPDHVIDDIAQRLPEISEGAAPRPSTPLPDVSPSESFPCRDEFDRYRLALYQTGYRGQEMLGLQQAEHSRDRAVRDASALAGGLVGWRWRRIDGDRGVDGLLAQTSRTGAGGQRLTCGKGGQGVARPGIR